MEQGEYLTQDAEDLRMGHVQNAPLGGILMLMEFARQSTTFAKHGVTKTEIACPATKGIL